MWLFLRSEGINLDRLFRYEKSITGEDGYEKFNLKLEYFMDNDDELVSHVFVFESQREVDEVVEKIKQIVTQKVYIPFTLPEPIPYTIPGNGTGDEIKTTTISERIASPEIVQKIDEPWNNMSIEHEVG